MAKNPNIREIETWTESKMQMVSILTTKIRKIKVDHHSMNVDINEFHMGIHSQVCWLAPYYFKKHIFPEKYNGLCHLLLE